jgi:hypothetical protein
MNVITISQAFSPKALKLVDNGRSSDLLPSFLNLPVSPVANSGVELSKKCIRLRRMQEITASGNVRDSHPVPY